MKYTPPNKLYQCSIIEETEKEYLFDIIMDNSKIRIWLPKSEIEMNENIIEIRPCLFDYIESFETKTNMEFKFLDMKETFFVKNQE